jgi:hypothetical protein
MTLEWLDSWALQERMAEYAFGLLNNGPQAGFMNFLFNVTKNCDCMTKDERPIAPDIGILASLDPVAIDRASVELINEACGRDVFREAHPHIDWQIQLNYAAGLGMGSLEYELAEIKL